MGIGIDTVTKSTGKLRRRRYWTEAELQQLRDLYPDTPTAEIARLTGRLVGSVYQKALSIGLRKSASYLSSVAACRLRQGDEVGKEFRFQKGHASWNKGRKGWTPGGASIATRFQEGHRPHTWRPVGTERINADGYRDRKISDTGYPPRDWRGVHLLLWEEHHGPVPAGHAVVFRNGNKADIRIENLELITRRELMARNTVHNLPPAIVQVVQLRGALVRQINRRTKEQGAQA